ncbi:MAG: hypothetical protein ACM3S4_04350 [Burkholderiales bacterium]
MPTNRNDTTGRGRNLEHQVDAAFKRSHELSIETRYTYWDSASRFARYAGEIWNLKNIRNMDDRHVQGYVAALLDSDCSVSYIKTELSGIRHLHHIVDGKRPIHPRNDFFGVGRREAIALPGATHEQYQMARKIAIEIGKPLIALSIDYMELYGARINESQAFRCIRIKLALEKGYLELSQEDGTKGGRLRRVTVETQEQKDLLLRTLEFIHQQKKTNSDRVMTGREKGAVHKAKAEIERFFVKYRDVLGGISPHDFRRAFAQDVYDRTPGTDAERMAVVCQYLGHGSGRADITARYVANRHAR